MWKNLQRFSYFAFVFTVAHGVAYQLTEKRRSSIHAAILQFAFAILFACPLVAQSPYVSGKMTRDIGGSAPAVLAQDSVPDAPAPQVEDKDTVTLRNTPVHILKDQAAVWTSPIHVRAHDLVWLAPFAAATGAGIATDHHVMASVVSHDASFNQANVNTSNALIGGFIAAPVAFYGFGHFHQDAHAREAGILSGEALVDGVVVEQGFKLIFWRERPNLDNARGLFFQSTAGWDSSLPSSHSVLAWSAAAVIAGEYPSRWTQLGVYSLASGVSLTRVLGQQHFPTDVLVGSLAGWLIGHYVYRTHHRPSRGGHR